MHLVSGSYLVSFLGNGGIVHKVSGSILVSFLVNGGLSSVWFDSCIFSSQWWSSA